MWRRGQLKKITLYFFSFSTLYICAWKNLNSIGIQLKMKIGLFSNWFFLLNMIFDTFCVSAKCIFWHTSISWWRFIFCHSSPPSWLIGRRIFHLLSLWQLGQMWLAPGIFGSTPGHFCWFWTSPCESHIFLTPTCHKTHLPYHADYFYFAQPTLVRGVEVVRERSKGTAPASRPSDSSPMALDKSRRWVATFVMGRAHIT